MTAAGCVLAPGEFEITLAPADGVVAGALGSGDAVVILDAAVTGELEAEGLARDAVRLIQNARRDQGLVVTDRVAVEIAEASEAVAAAVDEWRGYVAEQVLAASITGPGAAGGPPDGGRDAASDGGGVAHDTELDGPFRFTLRRV